MACSATLSHAAYQFHWDRPADFDGTAGPFYARDDAGALTSLTLTYEEATQNLTLLAVFAEAPDTGVLPFGFEMIINDGPEPDVHDSDYAILRFYTNSDGLDPKLKAYSYGLPWQRQTIATSWDDVSWINNLSITDVDDTRVFAFDIDASVITGFEPEHSDPAEWFGVGFDDTIGAWIRNYGWYWPSYDGPDSDFLQHWRHGRGHGCWPHPVLKRGYFDFADQPTNNNDIPEPASLTLLALGAAALGRRDRGRVSR